MNRMTLERPDVAAYLAAVRAELADLPGDECEELLADVEASLVDAGEPPPLAPADFAAELRDAAGLQPSTASGAPRRPVLDLLRDIAASERGAAVLATARELAPIWWLLRAYAATAGVALLLGLGWPIGAGTSGSGVRLGETLLAVFVAAFLSVWLGLRARSTRAARPRIALAANLLLALVLAFVLAHSLEQVSLQRGTVVTVPAEPTPGLALDGVPLRNLYPYSRDGRLLLDVLLYDEKGRPVEIVSAADDPQRRVLAARDGTPVLNSFPIRYYEPGTRAVAQPELGPPVALPEIVTPPLERTPR